MAQIETWLNQDMMQAVKVRYLDGNLFSQDNAGNLIGVKLTRDGEDYSGGGTVSANVIRADGGTVAVTGALSGNVATVVLPQSAYAVPGVVSIVVKLTVSGAIITIAAVVANIYQSSTETAIDPGTIIPSIQTLINQINTAVASIPADYSSLWETLAPAFSTSTAYTIGQYVTYDGGLYRFTSAHPAGAWSSSDTTAAVVGNVFTDLQTGKADKTDPVFYGTISKGRKGNSQAGTGSVALGDNVTANGWFSQAEGQGTIANGSYQRASGKYNVADTGNTYAEMVGNGYAEVDPQTFAVTEHRSNARTLDWNGNETLAGDLTVNKGTANEVTLGAEVSNLKNEIKWNDEATDMLDAIGSVIPFTSAQGGELWDNLISILRGTFVSHSVVWSGSNYTASNTSAHIADEASYSCTVTPAEGFVISALTVAMGNEAIVPTQNQDGTYTITIASVTDDVVIAVTTSLDPSVVIYHVENLVCDGTQSPIETSLQFSSASANGVTDDWTICAKASTNGNNYYKYIFCAGSDKTRIGFNSYTGSAGEITTMSNSIYTKGMINNIVAVVITHSAGSVDTLTRYYIDPATDELKTDVFTIAYAIQYLSNNDGRTPLVVGATADGSNAFIGTIEDLTIYRRLLTYDEISAYITGGDE